MSSSSSSSSSSKPSPLASDVISNISTWHYKNPERNQKGGFSNYIVEKPGDYTRITVQTTAEEGEPRCTAPFGISKPYDAAKAEDNKRNFELSVNSPKLREFVLALDENNKKQATENYDVWFAPADGKKPKKALTREDIEVMYRPLFQEQETFAPLFRTKVFIKGENKVRVYIYQGVRNGQPVCTIGTLEDIVPFVECIAVMEIVGLWYMSKQFGASIITTDVIVFPKRKQVSGAFNFGGRIPAVMPNDQFPTENLIVPTEEASSSFQGVSENTHTIAMEADDNETEQEAEVTDSV